MNILKNLIDNILLLLMKKHISYQMMRWKKWKLKEDKLQKILKKKSPQMEIPPIPVT